MKLTFSDDDFVFEWFSGQGAGGQHRNKHMNCARVTHIGTGIKANGTSSKSRESNKRNALGVCKARVVAHFSVDTERYRATDERVRTYHEPDNRVIDHLSGETGTYKKIVLDGNLESMIEARRKAKLE